MGRRSDFERLPRDLYETWDENAVFPLLKHLNPNTRYVEPTAGTGALCEHLNAAGHICLDAYDIEPGVDWIKRRDALSHVPEFTNFTFICNLPWTRSILHPLITHLSDIAPTWILLDAAWKATKQSRPFQRRMRKIVTVGRVCWIRGTNMKGKEDCEWLLLDKPDPYARPVFFGPIK